MKSYTVMLTLILSFNLFSECNLTDKEYSLGYEIKNEMYDIKAKLKFRCNNVRFEIVKDDSKRIDWISCDILEKKYDIDNLKNNKEWQERKTFNKANKLDYILSKEWNSAIEFQSGTSKGNFFVLPLTEKNHDIYCINQFNEKELTEYRPFKLEPTTIYIN